MRQALRGAAFAKVSQYVGCGACSRAPSRGLIVQQALFFRQCFKWGLHRPSQVLLAHEPQPTSHQPALRFAHCSTGALGHCQNCHPFGATFWQFPSTDVARARFRLAGGRPCFFQRKAPLRACRNGRLFTTVSCSLC